MEEVYLMGERSGEKDIVFESTDYKKKNWTIRMDITMDRDMSQEDVERTIFSALRSAGMKAHKGGIS
jgi:hypothetical protein